MLNLLTQHSNVNCLYCTPTLIASFTSVFSSFTSANVDKLQYTAACALTTGDIDPGHSWLRGPRCITNETCIATFDNKLIFGWLNACRHCNFKGHLRCNGFILSLFFFNITCVKTECMGNHHTRTKAVFVIFQICDWKLNDKAVKRNSGAGGSASTA